MIAIFLLDKLALFLKLTKCNIKVAVIADLKARMFFLQHLTLCSAFIEQLNESLETIGARPLSRTQRLCLSICITGILITNTLCWERFERACFGRYSANAISKMFCNGKIFWEKLLFASVCQVKFIFYAKIIANIKAIPWVSFPMIRCFCDRNRNLYRQRWPCSA